ncbi:hypothetical protein GVAV_002300 [Gurleya vavrai]
MSNEAETLFSQKEFTKLKQLFATQLKTSTDIHLFKTYLNYLAMQNKPYNIYEVYEYIFKKLRHHWDIFEFINDYNTFLQKDTKIQEDEKIEKIRKVFNMFLNTPMKNFNLFWKNYENFENNLNKITAKKIIDDALKKFQNTYKLYLIYKNLLDYNCNFVQDNLKLDNFYAIIEAEEKNLACYSDEFLIERVDFVYKFFAEKYPKEEIYSAWSEFLIKNNKKDEALNVCKNGIKALGNNLFLICYASNACNHDFFEDFFNTAEYSFQNDLNDLMLINYLSLTYKKSGLESFRNLFKGFLGKPIGPHVYIFAAQTEFFALQNKDIPFKLYLKAISEFPSNNDLKEKFVNFLLQIGDFANARAFFDQFEKTNSICRLMAEYEIFYGSFEKYREINFINEEKNEPDYFMIKEIGKEGDFLRYKNFIQFFNIKFDQKNVLDDFLYAIKNIKSEFLIFDNFCVIEALKNIEIV